MKTAISDDVVADDDYVDIVVVFIVNVFVAVVLVDDERRMRTNWCIWKISTLCAVGSEFNFRLISSSEKEEKKEKEEF